MMFETQRELACRSSYAGTGIAWNESPSTRIDPMLAAGLDWVLAGRLVLDLNLNHLLQPGDTDAEFTASLNYAFSPSAPR